MRESRGFHIASTRLRIQSTRPQPVKEVSVQHESRTCRCPGCVRRAAERVVGVVSHDLRTPLTAIRIGIDQLGMAELDPCLTRLVTRMDEASRRAQRLVEDLLDFTRASSDGSLPVTCRAINLHTAVAIALAELSLACPPNVLQHEARGDGACVADQERMVQAIGNLVVNAATHGDPGKPIRVVSGQRRGNAYVSVHNYGLVIPRAFRTRMFEPMVRAVGTRTVAGGLGLGLFIVRGIARSHHGGVRVVSTRAKGTTFTISWRGDRARISP